MGSNNIIDITNINHSNSVKGDWKETYNMFNSLIQTPKMTEKLLKRPPPLYIYDIIMNTMKKTGFPKGLFTTDEENKDYFKSNPNNKLDILQKAIDITRIVMNEYFDIKCTDILKGVETEKTNYFLQSFYKLQQVEI